ncbi:MAG: acyl-CoA dehydrogenase family protein [Burkholderiaceae bacterium]|jgi:alkylation response protein AidB-like acyl-CoA dehydrogenase|nr:acyl-CoA dehydrogenase family protein [Burkholderiaceae bacterium]MEB2318718.1 acyl-CoA dehydrogenase family protein [Pseudomonadota bacterium]
MDFTLNEEEQLLADSVNRLIEKTYDFEARKAITRSDTGFDPKFWASLAELGLIALPLPEEQGGFGSGVLGMISVLKPLGRGLVVEPYVPTVTAARLIAVLGSDAQKAMLEQVVGGELKLALAHGEPASRYNLNEVSTRATRAGSGYKLAGEKRLVLGASVADRLLVSARTAGADGDTDGVSLFLVDPAAKGLVRKTYRTNDDMRGADLVLDGVEGELVGAEGGAYAAIEEAVDFATLLECADAVGAMNYANEATLEYLKTRKQFGVPIGSFQALQHRMVDMTVEARQAESMLLLAASQFDDAAKGKLSASERRRFVSAAKVKCADAARKVGQEAIQMHGGMGMTYEMKVAHTFKRLTMFILSNGDIEHHLARYAANAYAA